MTRDRLLWKLIKAPARVNIRALYPKFLLGICRHQVNAESGFLVSHLESSLLREIAGSLNDRSREGHGLFVVDR
jgi:hypothetical protein